MSARIDRGVVWAILALFATLPAVLPLIGYVVAPGPAERGLGKLNAFLAKHAHVIGASVCFVFAAYLAIKGATALSDRGQVVPPAASKRSSALSTAVRVGANLIAEIVERPTHLLMELSICVIAPTTASSARVLRATTPSMRSTRALYSGSAIARSIMHADPGLSRPRR